MLGYQFASLPKAKQQKAVSFLVAQLFSTPDWLRDNQLYSLTTTDFSSVESIQKRVIQQLLDNAFFSKLRTKEMLDPTTAYTTKELLDDLFDGIFGELKGAAYITKNRRFMQKVYVNNLVALIETLTKTDSDAGSVVKAQAKKIRQQCNLAAARTKDLTVKTHLMDLSSKIEIAVYRPMRAAR